MLLPLMYSAFWSLFPFYVLFHAIIPVIRCLHLIHSIYPQYFIHLILLGVSYIELQILACRNCVRTCEKATISSCYLKPIQNPCLSIHLLPEEALITCNSLCNHNPLQHAHVLRPITSTTPTSIFSDVHLQYETHALAQGSLSGTPCALLTSTTRSLFTDEQPHHLARTRSPAIMKTFYPSTIPGNSHYH